MNNKNINSSIEEYFHPIYNQRTLYTPYRQTSVFVELDEYPSIPLLESSFDEKYCAFCLGNIHLSTPDKLVVTVDDTSVIYHEYPGFHHDIDNILFRRQGNLFEIIDYDYWVNKYDIQVSDDVLYKINQMFQQEESKNILTSLIMQKQHKKHEFIDNLSDEQLKNMCIPFYAGFHELLTSGRHYLKNGTNTRDVYNSGRMSWQEHNISFNMIMKIITDMCTKNPFIQFISIFQNWQYKAGASFEHWHKQILALDFWGDNLEREAHLYKKNIHIYKDFVYETSIIQDLVIAENKHAIAYVEIGGKTGNVVICSKSQHLRPHEHSQEEISAMSDLTHAVLSVIPPLTPYNEEWFYTPFGQEEFKTPWRILLALRTHTVAGFENITNIYINPISPKVFASQLRTLLQNNFSYLAPDIVINPLNISQNILQYNRKL